MKTRLNGDSIYNDCGQKIVGQYLCEVKFQHTKFDSVIEKSPDLYTYSFYPLKNLIRIEV